MREVRKISKVIIERHRIVNLNNFNKDSFLNKFMVRRCNEKGCNGELTLIDGEWFCKKCGIVEDSIEDTIDLEDKFFRGKSEIKIKPKDKNWRKSFHWKSDLKKLKEQGIIIKPNKKINEAIKFVNQLESFVAPDLPQDTSENLFKELKEMIILCYNGGKHKTRKKKSVVWAYFLFLAKLELERNNLNPFPTNPDIVNMYGNAFQRLNEIDKETFEDAENLRIKIIKESYDGGNKNKGGNEKLLVLSEIDSASDKIFSDEFKNLLSNKEMNNEELEYRQKIIEYSIKSVFAGYIEDLRKRLEKEGKNNNSVKRTGLACVLGYHICKIYSLKPKPREDWCKFFGIGIATFKNLSKEIKPSIDFVMKLSKKV